MDWYNPTVVLLTCFVLLLFATATWVTYLVERPSYLQSSGGDITLKQGIKVKMSSQNIHDETHDVARQSLASETISTYPLRPGSSWIPVFDIVPIYHGFDPFGTQKHTKSYRLSVDHELFAEESGRAAQFLLFKVPHPLISVHRIEFAGRFTYTGSDPSARINTDALKKALTVVIRRGGAFGTADIATLPVEIDILSTEDDETQTEHGFHMVIDVANAMRGRVTSFQFESPTEGSTEVSTAIAGISGTAGVITVGTEPVTKFTDLASAWTGKRDDIGVNEKHSLTGQIDCGWKGCGAHNAISGEPSVYLRNDTLSDDVIELTLKQDTRMTVHTRRPAFLPGVQPEHHHL